MFFPSGTYGSELPSPWSWPHHASEQWVTFNSRVIILTLWIFQQFFGICRCLCGCQPCQMYHNYCVCTIILSALRCKKNPQMDYNSSDSWQVTSPANLIRTHILVFSVKSPMQTCRTCVSRHEGIGVCSTLLLDYHKVKLSYHFIGADRANLCQTVD